MGNGVPGLELLRLWPSTFLHQSLPDHEERTRLLEVLAREQAAENIFASDEASVDWLKANIIHGVVAYLREAGFTRPPRCSVSGRFDIQRFTDIRPLRNRTGTYLAGTYVVTSPASDEGLGAREDRRPASVTFYDPRTGINMNSIRRDPYLDYHHTVPLVPGLLLIWPAFVSYFEHPNHSREPAVRVAFDIHLEDGGGSP